jgi:Phage capsid protein
MATGVLTVQPHYEPDFDRVWHEIMAQQIDHRLAGYYVSDTVVGVSKRYSQMGSQSYAMSQKTARAAWTEPSDVPTAIRWVIPTGYQKATWIDEDDPELLGSLPDPGNIVAMNHAIAVNRLKDQILINQALGTNFTGATSSTQTVLPSTQQVGVQFPGSTNTGMTLAKILEGLFILDSNDVPEMDRVMVYAAKQLYDLLLNVDQVDSVLYNDVRALMKGRFDEFAGFRWIRTQLLPTAGTPSIRSCFCYQKKFMLLGETKGMATKIDLLPQQSGATQVRTTYYAGATRMEEAGVVLISCDETQ